MEIGKTKIIIQPIEEIQENLLRFLKEGLEGIFSFDNLKAEVWEKILSLRDSEYNRSRGQYKGSKVLERLLNLHYIKKTYRILGVMDKDLYSRNLNFIFGIATSPRSLSSKRSGAALISITRLRQEFYRKPKNKILFQKRVLKEGVHELGHTFGLGHCNNYCIMTFSNHLGETDEKPLEFCKSCSKKLKTYFQNI
ncbi:MAG: archemetzincin [Promethearchaeota archaeon]|nr:MAG: archemetzincin [Candidatus Lokiarchaeota archaeon]